MGWHVVIHYRSSGKMAEALAATLPSAETFCCDLSDTAAAAEMINNLAASLGNWRCLINSASVFRYDNVTSLNLDTNREAMLVNALAPAAMSIAYLAQARGAGPRCVINVTDMKLENANPDFFSYTMSKHAMASTIAMFAIHARSAKWEQARVYGIAPGAILASHDQSEGETEVSHRLNLLKRKTQSQEIVEAALFLATGVLRSGSTLFIDSGQHLLSQERDVIYLARQKSVARP